MEDHIMNGGFVVLGAILGYLSSLGAYRQQKKQRDHEIRVEKYFLLHRILYENWKWEDKLYHIKTFADFEALRPGGDFFEAQAIAENYFDEIAPDIKEWVSSCKDFHDWIYQQLLESLPDFPKDKSIDHEVARICYEDEYSVCMEDVTAKRRDIEKWIAGCPLRS